MEHIKSSYTIEDDVVILESLEVAPEHRGKGLAKKFMKEFIDKFKNQRIELHAYAQDESTSTERLVEFYKSLGFDVVCGDESCGYSMELDPFC